jgi:hypothetical protein
MAPGPPTLIRLVADFLTEYPPVKLLATFIYAVFLSFDTTMKSDTTDNELNGN